MTDPALSAMIREVLSEELAKLKPVPGSPGTSQTAVSINNDADLNAFARDLVERMADPAFKQDMTAGRIEFTLSTADRKAGADHQPVGATTGEHRIDKGFLSERHIGDLPKGTKRLLVGKAVRITPLARDRARQRDIVIERIEP